MPTSFSHLLEENRVFSLPHYKHHLLSNLDTFQKLYEESIHQPELFWGKMAKNYFWFQEWNKVQNTQWGSEIKNEWFEGGQTNLCYNALDRHLTHKAHHPALIWQGNQNEESKTFTFKELLEEVCKVANALKQLGVKKGDRVAIYMGMTPELPITLLACSRIGAIHNVIFGGFSAESLKERILDCSAQFVVTADGLFRGAKSISLKSQVDQALLSCEAQGHLISACLILRRTFEKINLTPQRDFLWDEIVPSQKSECPPEKMNAEDPLFILYTSGSTGKPKGVVHSTAGYMVYIGTTFSYLFNPSEKDLFWCTADIGWITGHSYSTYAPLLCGTTTLLFEGVPNYPAPNRFWEIIEKYKVNIFYTAPTAIRALMSEGDHWVNQHNLSSLKLLGSVGEPINPEAWMWYFKIVGKEKCPIIDTWWQTETGGILVSPIPGISPLKPGSAGFCFFGIQGKILKEDGSECTADEGGYWVLEKPWPSVLRGVWGQKDRVQKTYFEKFPSLYFSGDGARKDQDGHIWFLGRVDDVLNVSGHRIGTAELESAFVNHVSVAEAAVVGFTHPLKGQGIYAFITPKKEYSYSSLKDFEQILIQHISQEIGPIAKPDHLQIVAALPKTRSGKIMRRILRKIAEGQIEELGDLSTLADSQAVADLIQNRKRDS